MVSISPVSMGNWENGTISTVMPGFCTVKSAARAFQEDGDFIRRSKADRGWPKMGVQLSCQTFPEER